MEKVKINIQIVTMRKHVKQAKIHCINKLAKESEKLQNRKGDEKIVEKCKRKANRCLEEISIIQKIKPDVLSKKALCKIKDWKDVLQRKDSSLEDRCLAMLVTFKGVQEAIDQFFSANFDLVPKIPSLIEDMETNAAKKKLENNSRKKDRKSKKLQKRKNVSNGSDSNKKAKELDQSEENKSNECIDGQSGSVQSESQSESTCCAENVNKKLPDDHILSEIRKIRKETGVNSDALKEFPSFDDNEKEALSEDDVHKNTSSNDEFDELSGNDYDDDELSGNDYDDDELSVNDHDDDELSGNDDDDEELSGNDHDDDELSGKDNDESLKTPTMNISLQSNKKLNPTSTVTSSEKNKQEGLSSSKKSLKAVTLLNLEELKDCDEIPIGHTEDISEDQSDDSVKRKKDGFFLNDASDSDDSTHSDLEENKFFKGNKRRFENRSPNKFQFNSEKFQTNYSGNRFQRRNSAEKFPFSKKFPAREGFTKDRFGPRRDFRSEGRNNFRNKNAGFKHQEKSNSFSDSSRDQRSNFKDKKFSPKFKSNDTFNREKPYQKKSMPTMQKNVPTEPKKFHKEKSGNSTNTDKPLHPSWEAKRKLKNTAPVKFEGKRMVFD